MVLQWCLPSFRKISGTNRSFIKSFGFVFTGERFKHCTCKSIYLFLSLLPCRIYTWETSISDSIMNTPRRWKCLKIEKVKSIHFSSQKNISMRTYKIQVTNEWRKKRWTRSFADREEPVKYGMEMVPYIGFVNHHRCCLYYDPLATIFCSRKKMSFRV